jgi:hypothetical protein
MLLGLRLLWQLKLLLEQHFLKMEVGNKGFYYFVADDIV